MDAIWHSLVHFAGIDYGLPYGKWGWYNLWSGFGAILERLIELAVIGGLIYWHHTCQHSPWCLRLGKHPVAGGLAKACHRHHPDLKGRKPRGAELVRLHREWQALTGKKAP